MPRGGKRPGAGAPKGNFNALKHGRRSAQFAMLGHTLAADPKTRDAVLNFASRLEGQQQTAIKGAVELHVRIIEEARKIARGEPSPLEHVLRDEDNTENPLRLSVQSHDAERRSIKRNTSSAPTYKHGRATRKNSHTPHNQRPNTIPPAQSKPKHEKDPKTH